MMCRLDHLGIAALGVGALFAAFAARVEASEAVPASPCNAPPPSAGVEIRGPVLHVIDGQTLCVALGFETSRWVRLRLADADVPPPVRKTSTAGDPRGDPRGALMQVALAKMAVCRTARDRAGQVVAVCEIEGRPIGEQLRDPAVVAASYGWR